ncbi:MAG TPA: esterase-like activity of phytase family protein [Hyphomicrobiaceae bacterium]|nr:esterase-like activity of phytase family protein [Hyphomicrobiaceae bacterium]
MIDANPPMPIHRRAVVGGLLAVVTAPFLARAFAEDNAAPATRVEHIEIDARPIAHFERDRPEAKRFGPLEFRGGLVLTSSANDFGGWSALIMEPAGRSLLAISDEGSWMAADVDYEGARSVGLSRARIGPLLGADGRPLTRKVEHDAEAATLIEGTLERGTLLIGFERHHRIDRYVVERAEVGRPTGTLELPAEAKRMPANLGIEALTTLKAGPYKGSVVAFAERLTRGSGYHTGWIWVGGEPQKFQLKDIDGFNITDAAGLADGSLLVLERFFQWSEGVKMRLRHLAAEEIAPGARLTGRTLVEADASFDIDNMEGLGVHRGSNGELILSLISDDNFNHILQRTIFLQFMLHED